MAENLGASFTIDTTDLKAGLAQANRLIRESESEFRAAAAGMEDWSNSQEGLEARSESLNKQIEIQRAKVSALVKNKDELIRKMTEEGKSQEEIDKAVDAANKSITRESKELDRLTKELGNTDKALEKMNGSTDKGAKEVKNLGDAAKESADGFTIAKGAIADFIGSGLTALAGAVKDAAGSLLSLAADTRESRTNMAKLETSFSTAGHSAEDAADTYKALYGVLGDDGQATEAASHLAQLTNSQEELAAWTDIATGVYATFGDSLPIENLAEAANETAKTGKLTGGLADSLNWAGVNEEEFQKSLDKCTTEQERQALITETLNGLYSEASDKYKEVNEDVIKAQEAQAEFNEAMNELGKIAEPIMTTLKELTTDLLKSITPFVGLIGEGLSGALAGTAGSSEKLAEGLSGIVDTLVTSFTGMLPTLIDMFVTLVPAIVTTLVGQLPNIMTALLGVVEQIMDALTDTLPQVVTAIVEVVPQLIKSLISFIPQLLKAAVQLLMAIVDALPALITSLIAEIPKIWNTIADALIKAIPILIQAAIQLLNSILTALPVIIQALVVALPQVIYTIVDAIVQGVPLLVEGAITLLMAIVDAIPVIIDALIEALPVIVDTVVFALLQMMPTLVDGAIEFFMAILEALPTIITELVKATPRIVTTVIQSLTSRIPILLQGALRLFRSILDAIPTVVVELAKEVPKLVKQIVTSLTGGIADVTAVGKDIVRGLWNGINDMTAWLAGKIRSFCSNALEAIKAFFGIKSPSRVMADVVGKNLALGIGEGFEDNIGEVNKEVTSAIKVDGINRRGEAESSAESLASGSNRGSVVINQYNNYSQAHSRYELYRTKQQTVSAVKLAMGGA